MLHLCRNTCLSQQPFVSERSRGNGARSEEAADSEPAADMPDHKHRGGLASAHMSPHGFSGRGSEVTEEGLRLNSLPGLPQPPSSPAAQG